jgi:redox-sensitive bicupin YhaK (pirin superfamily)
MNPSPTDEVHFVQMWVPPDTEGIAPGYEQRDVNGDLDKGGLRPIASGQGHDGAIAIHQRDAVLWGARLPSGESSPIPDGGYVHLFVAAGDVELEDAGALGAGDAARLSRAGELALAAGVSGAKILVWVRS